MRVSQRAVSCLRKRWRVFTRTPFSGEVGAGVGSRARPNAGRAEGNYEDTGLDAAAAEAH